MTSISRRPLVRGLLTVLPVLAMTLSAGAQGISGTGELLAKDKLAAKGCGRTKLAGPQTLTMTADGSWTAASDGGDTLGGTYVAVGTKGRKFDLDFDGPGLALFRATLEEDLSDLCQTPVQVTTIDAKSFKVKLNRSATKATVKAKFRLTGTANGEEGKGSFKLKAKGPWTSMPSGSPSGAFPAE